MKIIDVISLNIEPIILSFGVNVWDIVFEKEGKNKFLRVYIFKENGDKITLDDCEIVSKAVSKKLDEIDIVNYRYFLEVSSVGLNVRLTKERHFINSVGARVFLKFKKPFEGLKKLKGILKDYETGLIKIETKDELFTIQLENCSFVKLCDDLRKN